MHLYFLALDPGLADRRAGPGPELWWSAEWGHGQMPWLEDSAQRLGELVDTVLSWARHNVGGIGAIRWCLHQDPADPAIGPALADTGVALPDHLDR